MRLALDTNRYIDLCRGAPEVVTFIEEAELVFLPFVVLQGTPIPTNDLWIAALVLEHDLILCARDRHFDNLPQISQA